MNNTIKFLSTMYSGREIIVKTMIIESSKNKEKEITDTEINEKYNYYFHSDMSLDEIEKELYNS